MNTAADYGERNHNASLPDGFIFHLGHDPRAMSVTEVTFVDLDVCSRRRAGKGPVSESDPETTLQTGVIDSAMNAERRDHRDYAPGNEAATKLCGSRC